MNISSYILRLGAILGKNSSNNWLSSVRDRVKENNDITFTTQNLYIIIVFMWMMFAYPLRKILKKKYF